MFEDILHVLAAKSAKCISGWSKFPRKKLKSQINNFKTFICVKIKKEHMSKLTKAFLILSSSDWKYMWQLTSKLLVTNTSLAKYT